MARTSLPPPTGPAPQPADAPRRRWLQAAPGLGLGLLAGFATSAAPAQPAPVAEAEADSAPPIEWPALRTVQGTALPASRGTGVPMVVVFWATWCGYCRRHNAHVDRLYRSVDPTRLRVLGVALDRDAAVVRRYLQQMGYSFPTVADGAALRERFTTRRVIPMTCVLDALGRLEQAIPGEMSEADVMALARSARPPR